MAFSDLETQRIKNTIQTEFMDKRRPPLEARNQVDLSYRIQGHSIELFEIRASVKDESKMIETQIAKATFIKTQKIWQLFWMRQDMKWHGYEGLPQAESLAVLLDEVANDSYGCFFG